MRPTTTSITPAAPHAPTENPVDEEVLLKELLAKSPDAAYAGPLVRKVRLRPRTAGPSAAPAFDSGEHVFLGNEATLWFPTGSQSAANVQFTMTNGLSLTYGQIVALAGDFFGPTEVAISDAEDKPKAFLHCFDTLDSGKEATTEVPALWALMQKELTAIAQAQNDGTEPSQSLIPVARGLDYDYGEATGGGKVFGLGSRYYAMAKINWDHFGQQAVEVWKVGHAAAIAWATTAGQSQDLAGLNRAYTLNAFADHYLTDLFSAGHLRTPRKQLYEASIYPRISGLCAKLMHDEDNLIGLKVQNANGDSWTAYGDGYLLDTTDETNYTLALQAVNASVADIAAAYQQQSVSSSYAALTFIPDLAKVQNWKNKANSSPLFVYRHGSVERRDPIGDLNKYHWTRSWDAPSTYLAYSHTEIASQTGDVGNLSALDDTLLRVYPTEQNKIALQAYSDRGPERFGKVWSNKDMGHWPDQATWITIDPLGEGLTSLLCLGGNSSGGLTGLQLAPDPTNGYSTVWKDDSLATTRGQAFVAARRNLSGLTSLVQVRAVGTSGWALDVMEPRRAIPGFYLLSTGSQLATAGAGGTTVGLFAMDVAGVGYDYIVQLARTADSRTWANVYAPTEKTYELVKTYLPTITWPEPFASGAMWLPGDFNGDGQEELACVWNSEGKTCISYMTPIAESPGNDWYHYSPGTFVEAFALDVNGDGVDEVVTIVPGSTATELTIKVFKMLSNAGSQLVAATTVQEGDGSVAWLPTNSGSAGAAGILQLWAQGETLNLIPYTSDVAQGPGLYQEKSGQSLGSMKAGQQFFMACRGDFPQITE